ncbi:uncharacterized protein TRIADDRAFT_63983 [Trichoplax adhaerens]|uniref:Aminopeptidase n=1 Tax=Trichoplax adhaerens TaxID=10228 RepID=B3S0G8_TRIAD|nr:hypothetical protein TRIADDRAFT_63983 [Trichoplax adhaerens]EDV23637.1 hypothetical protein TRIADDRAFT_63983 [Trichoplax adhaerens]|eukprot:XP_002113163.1 hypothetical protein TRIADDRAFT_63983 [Trichoplax adhaerens]
MASKDGKSGVFCSNTKLIITILLVIGLIVAVGLIAGLTSRSGSTGNQQSTTMTVTQPVSTTAPPKYPQLNNRRLPTNVKPLNYTFTLDIDMTKLSYNGNNVIRFQVTSPTNVIIVHTDGITVTSAPKVASDSTFSNTFTVSDYGAHTQNNYYYVGLQNNLAAGIYYIQFIYTANLASDLNGLYKYQYTRASDRAVIWGVASQCEDFYARRILPCFDEPAMKATFTTTVVIPNNYTTLTNMPVTSTTAVAGNKMSYKFQPTVVMSSYLLAFTVDDFESVEARTARNTLVRVFSRKSIKNDGMYALGAAINITEFFENLLDVPYPLPKQDHVAVPSFDSGAMENWGLILYREELLTYNKFLSSTSTKESITTIVAHELAHMWFGNWVTMEWWNHLWLNEGFATFFAAYSASFYAPTMNLMAQFTTDDLQIGLISDASALSHPIVPPAQYGPFFDRITYQKGGSILRMLRDYMGHDDFIAGIKAYLKKYSYGNAITDQLFSTMTSTINNRINVTDFISCWIYQMGYPLITVKRSSSANSGVFSQARYLSNKNLDPNVDPPSNPYKATCGYKWNVPVTYYTGDAPSTTVRNLMAKSGADLTVNWPGNTWIKVNADQMGFFRVNYETSNWNQLAAALQADHTQYHLKILSPPADILGMMDSGDDTEKEARVSVLDYACFLGYSPCLRNASMMFQKFMQDPVANNIPGAIREIVFRYGIANGGVKEWDFLYNMYKNSLSIADRSRMLFALSYSRDDWILKRFLDYAIDPTKINPSSTTTIFSSVSLNPVGKYLAWDYVRQNKNYFIQRFRSTRPIIRTVTRFFNNIFRRNQVQQFFAENPESGSTATAFENAITGTINFNINYLQKYEKTLSTWFKANMA